MTRSEVAARLERLPSDEREYVLGSLPTNLAEAGRRKDWDYLSQLLTSFTFLQAKLEAFGPQRLLADYARCTEPDLRLIQEALQLSAPVLADNSTLLAGQLLGRLLACESPRIQALLEEATQWRGAPWLRPLTPSLTPPGGPLFRTLVGHTGAVTSVAVTPDGQWAISASKDGTLNIWKIRPETTSKASEPMDRSQAWRTLRGHTAAVNAVVVTPDGQRAVSASDDQTVKVWDVAHGEDLLTLRGHTASVNAVAVTPDGRYAVSASRDRTVRVWELTTGTAVLTLHGHTQSVGEIAVTSDGRYVVSAEEFDMQALDFTLKVWDLERGAAMHTLQGLTAPITAVAVTPDGQRILSAGGIGPIPRSRSFGLTVWDLQRGVELYTLGSHRGSLHAMTIMSDGHRVVGVDAHNLQIWDIESGETLLTLPGAGGNAVAVTPDQCYALSAAQDHTITIWNLQRVTAPHVVPKPVPSAEPWQRTFYGHPAPTHTVVVTPDGQRAISGAVDHTLQVWDLHSGDILLTLHGHTAPVTAVTVTPDGQRAISASDDGTVRVWELQQGQEVLVLRGHTRGVQAVAVTPDGQRAISGAADHTLQVWDLQSGAALMTLYGHTAPVIAVAVSPDGQRVVSADQADRPLGSGPSSTIKVWELLTGQEIQTATDHTTEILALAMLPDGQRVITAATDHTLKVWYLQTGVTLLTLRGHTGAVRSVAMLPDGRRVIAAASDTTVRVWDLETGGEVLTIWSAEDAVAVTPDGHYAVSISENQGALTVWNLERVPAGPAARDDLAMHAVAVTPDGRRVLFATNQGTLEVWDLEQRQPLRTLGCYNEHISAIAVTADSQYALTVSNGLKVWDIERGTALHTLPPRLHSSAAVAVLPNRHVIAQGAPHTLKLWALASGAELRTLPRLPFLTVKAIAVTPDQRCVIVIPGMPGRREGGDELDYAVLKRLYVLDLATDGPWRYLEGHLDEVYDVVAMPERQVISAAGDRTLKVWDLERDACVRTLEGHTAGIASIAVTADARRAYSVAGFNGEDERDHTLKVWDLERGEALATFVGEGPLTRCAVAPDGVTVIAIGAQPRQVHFLRLAGVPEPYARWRDAVTLSHRAQAAYAQGDSAQTLAYYQQSLQIARELQDVSLEGTLLANLGHVYVALQRYHEALTYFQQGLEAVRTMHDRQVVAMMLYHLGCTHRHCGTYDTAVVHARELLALVQETGAAPGELEALFQLGYGLLRTGELREACEHLQRLLTTARRLGDQEKAVYAHLYLSEAYRALGEHDSAMTHGEAAIAVCDLVGTDGGKAYALWHLALLLKQAGHLAQAIALLQRCVALERAIGHREVENHATQLAQWMREELDL